MEDYERTLFAAAQQFAGITNADLESPIMPEADDNLLQSWQSYIPALVVQSWPKLDRTARLLCILCALHTSCIVEPPQ